MEFRKDYAYIALLAWGYSSKYQWVTPLFSRKVALTMRINGIWYFGKSLLILLAYSRDKELLAYKYLKVIQLFKQCNLLNFMDKSGEASEIHMPILQYYYPDLRFQCGSSKSSHLAKLKHSDAFVPKKICIHNFLIDYLLSTPAQWIAKTH